MTLGLSEQDVSIILQSLAAQPFGTVRNVVEKIERQAALAIAARNAPQPEPETVAAKTE